MMDHHSSRREQACLFPPSKHYDILVIGGGINGAAIAHVAADNGLSVALVEKGDFASGTSSKSTKLMHGGLRYLEQADFGLVREALRERTLACRDIPHLVHPLEFIIPVYKSSPRPLWMMRLGVFLYDLLSGRHRIGRHRSLTSRQIREEVSGLEPEGLLGGVAYFDAQMDDARVCLENVLSARAKGAHVANYCEVTTLMKENGRVVGAQCRDVLTQKNFSVRAQKVVCAAGPWINQMWQMDHPDAARKIRTTKGVHLVYRERLSEKAVLLQTGKDKRIFFVIPWMNHSLIGTTDTDYSGAADKVEASFEDIQYLLNEARRFFPEQKLSFDKIITTFAGLRPLVYEPGSPGRVSRRHVIEMSNYSGMYYVMGGKYTTYRAIAEETVRTMFPQRTIKSYASFPLYGSGPVKADAAREAQEYGIDQKTVEYLRSKYGIRYLDILKLTAADPSLKERICTCCPDITAQVWYAFETEMARTINDILWRRLGIAYQDCQSKQCGQVINTLYRRWKDGQ
jgi:glycerol-3-phosphate dehydrogenase